MNALLSCGVRGLLALLSVTLSAAEPEACVIRSDGSEVCGTIANWDQKEIVIGGDAEQTVPIETIGELRFPRAQRRSQTSDWIILGTGDRFPLTVQRIENDTVTAGWARLARRPELSFPLENLAAIVRQMPPAVAVQREWLSAIARSPREKDTVRLVVGDDLTGEFTAWENGLVKWQGALGALQLDLQRVRWVRFDPELTTIPPRPEQCWTVFLVDGTRFTATECRPQPDQTVEWQLPIGGKLVLPRHEVLKATVWSSRRAPLSQREPQSTRFTPFLSGERTLLRDQSVAQAPQSLRGEEFATGLAMQSRAEVTYALQPHDEHFSATVGIDDVTAGRGSARFIVRVDDREVWASEELAGTMPAVRTPMISLAGAKILTLVVDFGEFADVADFADWGDASLWKTAPSR